MRWSAEDLSVHIAGSVVPTCAPAIKTSDMILGNGVFRIGSFCADTEADRVWAIAKVGSLRHDRKDHEEAPSAPSSHNKAATVR